ncbi:MAG: ferredoxin III, nif-specific [Magnetococcus sp. WYHC-3]
MSLIEGITRGGSPWTPRFLVALNHRNCIGCGRCYKVCSRQVLDLVERESLQEEEGESWEDDGFDDDVAHVMTIAHAEDCIGCEACSRVCPKNCQTHAPAERMAA